MNGEPMNIDNVLDEMDTDKYKGALELALRLESGETGFLAAGEIKEMDAEELYRLLTVEWWCVWDEERNEWLEDCYLYTDEQGK